jgi:hypothetical protein
MTEQTLHAEVLDVTADSELMTEVVGFYRDYLVPELICTSTGYSPWPHEGWLGGEGRDVLGVRDPDDSARLIGVWVVKEHGIFFPCVDVEYGGDLGLVTIFRALAELSVERHGEELFASTSNQRILDWAAQMGLPGLILMSDRLEWRA